MKFLRELLEGDVLDFAAARQRKMNPTNPTADRFRKAAAHLKANPRDFPKPPKASVSKLPLRSRDDVAKQVQKVMRDLDTSYKWIDDYTAMAHYNPADYVRATKAFDELFGERTRVPGQNTYVWDIDGVSVTFALETRKIIIEIE